ncbi:MAG TPA: mechanosensitive ion channel protein MscS [Acidobacteriaceae bacterium]|nr:mechanosensitive ion channel protein MscS [Acidobacteriaceae bacterium]
MNLRNKPSFAVNSLLVAAITALLLSPVLCAQTGANASAPQHSASSASTTPATNATAPAASAPQPAQDATGSERTRPSHAAPALTLEQQIEKLPPLTATKIDAKGQGENILQHLNEILRFYRAATTKIQKAGEPSDILYAEQSKAQATQIAQLAFQSARNEAALLTRVNASPNGTPAQGNTASEPQAQRLAAARARIENQITALQATDAANDAAIAHSNAKTRPALLERQEQIDGEFKFLQATLDALTRVANLSEAQGRAGLLGEIDRLASSAPELASGTGKSITAPPLETVADAQHAGLVTQGSVLFDLLSARRSIDQQISETDRLRDQADDLRKPFLNVLRTLIAQGETLTQQTVTVPAAPATSTQDILATRKQFDELTSTFRVLSDAMLPLTQEVTLLEQERGTLTSWSIATDAEYKSILRSLLIRAAFIAGALLLLFVASQVWGRATVRYVSDLRRRRQLLLVRRIVIGFVGGLIVIFGFVTQFSSLATFAGFISAGIAVGLQTILLSVAAYFFIVGRYGVRVGDRITVSGVTGTVIEVGIARFYMMELVGSGTELHSTGRVAVFANSVLFQTGTPLYKQLPGTEYAWHELTAKLKPEADTEAVSHALCGIIEGVYQTYKGEIESQQHQIENWMGAPVDRPSVDSHLRLADDGLQVAILFPVQIGGAAKADAAIASAILKAMQTEGPLKQGLAAVPTIKAAIKT